jgi:simple sugar transport system substrate-binding protein
MKSWSKVLISLFVIASVVISFGSIAAPEVSAQEPEYTFYYTSHIGPWDPNMYWLSKPAQVAAEIYNVEVVYQGPTKWDVEEQVELLNTAIAAEPDGIVVPITDPNLMAEPLREAAELGIPVIAANIEDPAPAGEKVPYLTYVGGDEYATGLAMGKRFLDEFEAQGKEVRGWSAATLPPGTSAWNCAARG